MYSILLCSFCCASLVRFFVSFSSFTFRLYSAFLADDLPFLCTLLRVLIAFLFVFQCIWSEEKLWSFALENVFNLPNHTYYNTQNLHFTTKLQLTQGFQVKKVLESCLVFTITNQINFTYTINFSANSTNSRGFGLNLIENLSCH